MAKSIRKGDPIRLLPPRNAHASQTRVWRRTTPEEQGQWRAEQRALTIAARERGEDTFSVNYDCAGESRLPPRDVCRQESDGEVYIVTRSRVRAPSGWGRSIPKCVEVEDSDGVRWYVRREHLDLGGE